MMVSLGAAIFTIAALMTAPDDSNNVTRVIQRVAAGIGILGAVAGLGQYALAASAGLVSLLVLAVLRPLTKAIGKGNESNKETSDVYEEI